MVSVRIVETVLPLNLDARDGYPVERERIFAASSGKILSWPEIAIMPGIHI